MTDSQRIEAARIYREQGQYHLALTCAQQARGAGGRLEEARALIWLGRYSEALPVARAGVAAAGEALKAEALATLSEALNASGSPTEALVLGQQAVAAAPAVSLVSGRAHSALAAAQHSSGRGPEAVGTATRGLAILGQLQARPHERAQLLHTLAEAYHVSGKHLQAAETWRKALAVRRAHLPASHPEVGASVSGMALSMRRLGLLTIAVDLHREALAIFTSCFDPDHPAIAACRHGLAQALHRQGHFTDAREQLAAALASSVRRAGPDHMNTWITRFELGRMEVDCGDPERGFAKMEAARLRLTEQLGPHHPTVKAMKNWL